MSYKAISVDITLDYMACLRSPVGYYTPTIHSKFYVRLYFEWK